MSGSASQIDWNLQYIEGHAREQALMLPRSVEDYVAVDNPVRSIDAFVDDLDLGAAGSGVRDRPVDLEIETVSIPD